MQLQALIQVFLVSALARLGGLWMSLLMLDGNVNDRDFEGWKVILPGKVP